MTPAAGAYDASCVFCRVARGEVAAHLVYEDDGHLAFLDHRPLFPGHVLVSPRPHVPTLLDLGAERLEPLFALVQAVGRAVERALGADGSFVAVNNRVSQSVPHLHVHVVPRRQKDGLRGFFWPRGHYTDDAEARSIAERLRAAVADERGGPRE